VRHLTLTGGTGGPASRKTGFGADGPHSRRRDRPFQSTRARGRDLLRDAALASGMCSNPRAHAGRDQKQANSGGTVAVAAAAAPAASMVRLVEPIIGVLLDHCHGRFVQPRALV
jgi:hypothetical protein